MAKAKKWTTAAEFIAQLEADPDWVRRHAENEARHAAEVAKLREETEPEHAPLRRDLAAVGLPIASIDDLINTSASYPEAIPVLLKHLATARHPVMRQCLARALTVREARGVAGAPVLDELERERDGDSETRWTLANTLTIVATPADADRIAALAADPAYADARERLERALKNLRRGRRSGRKTGSG